VHDPEIKQALYNINLDTLFCVDVVNEPSAVLLHDNFVALVREALNRKRKGPGEVLLDSFISLM
jgi:hypothetical protein